MRESECINLANESFRVNANEPQSHKQNNKHFNILKKRFRRNFKRFYNLDPAERKLWAKHF